MNMRGVKDTGAAFIAPTFLFVGTVLITVAVGAFRVFAAGGHPMARAADAACAAGHQIGPWACGWR